MPGLRAVAGTSDSTGVPCTLGSLVQLAVQQCVTSADTAELQTEPIGELCRAHVKLSRTEWVVAYSLVLYKVERVYTHHSVLTVES